MATQIDEAKQEAFAGHVLEVLNGASVTFLAGVAYQTGLFETLASLPAATSETIAEKAGLNERYVREILGGLVLGGFVEYDPGARTYLLPPEHAAFLTEEAGPDNLGHFTLYFARLAEVEPQVVQSVREGGGVPYENYPWFQPLQAAETGPVFDAAMEEVILPFAPGLVDRLKEGIRVLDVGTGGGHAANVIARAFPASTVVGIDISEDGLDIARKEAADLGLANVTFEIRDGTDIPEPGTWDLITTFDVIHDLARPREILRSIAGALADGGTYLMGDIAASSKLEENTDHPLGPTLHLFSVFYCMTTSLAQGGEGLGTVWGEQKAQELLAEAGFTKVEANHIEGDPIHVFYVATK